MLRWLALYLFRRSFVFFLLAVVACSAQGPSTSSGIDLRIERQIRTHFNIPPSVNVALSERKPSLEFPSYDTVTVTFSQGQQQQTQEFLVAKDGQTLVRLTKLDISKDPYAERMKKIDIEGRPTRGAPNAPVTIVNYDDFQCPFCARMYTTLIEELLPEYGEKIKLVIKDYPLIQIHPWALRAAINANCLAKQKHEAYWGFSDFVHENQQQISAGGASPAPGGKASLQQQQEYLDRLALEQAQKHQLQMEPLQACLKEQSKTSVEASMKEAAELGVEATPTLFINGQKVDGAIPASELRAMIDRALRDAGQSVPSHASEQSAPPAPAAQ